MHLLVEFHGQPGRVAALTPLSVDRMIVAASTTLLAESRSGSRDRLLRWALLVAGSAASLAANVAVAEPRGTGRIIAARPSFSLIADRNTTGAIEPITVEALPELGVRDVVRERLQLVFSQDGRDAVSAGAVNWADPASRVSPALRRAGSHMRGQLVVDRRDRALAAVLPLR